MGSIRTFAKSVAKSLAPQFLLDQWYEHRFFSCRRWENLHFGVFDSYQEAISLADRKGANTRYALYCDHEQWLRDRQDLRPHDYPMLFWLGQVLETDMRVVDIGGSLGVSYYAFKRVIDFPPGHRWQVCELEEVVLIGRRLALERAESALSFTTELGALEDASVLFTAGALQFLEPTLVQLLTALEKPPKEVLINRVPVTAQRSTFVTLQNTGESITPCRIVNVDQWTSDLARLGYRLVDRWKCLENSMAIPSHRVLSLDHFDGFYFSRTPT
jgi:putative methyltransferase (TIGR04325 family)